jgi:prephenate dehydratase
MRLAFLGPVGTYGEQAALQLVQLEGLQEVELVPQQGIRAVVQALASGACDAAVVPVENSVEGGVTACLDALWEHPDLAITRALVLPIRHALLGSGTLAGVSEVLSHPQALAQCSQWLAEYLPGALQLPTSSTAEAARMVAGSRFRAAVASRQAAREHGLEELAYPINDVAGNCTRFLLLRRETRHGSGPLASLAFSLHSNQPGALLEALGCFARRGLNMSRIESRPSKREMGEYIFFVAPRLWRQRPLARPWWKPWPSSGPFVNIWPCSGPIRSPRLPEGLLAAEHTKLHQAGGKRPVH